MSFVDCLRMLKRPVFSVSWKMSLYYEIVIHYLITLNENVNVCIISYVLICGSNSNFLIFIIRVWLIQYNTNLLKTAENVFNTCVINIVLRTFVCIYSYFSNQDRIAWVLQYGFNGSCGKIVSFPPLSFPSSPTMGHIRTHMPIQLIIRVH